MKKYLVVTFCVFSLVITGKLNSQQAHVNLDWDPQKNKENLVPFGAGLISPEVGDDNTVIFRVKAPEAKSILLSGTMLQLLGAKQPIPFAAGTDGIWTLKVGPLEPEIYYYKLIIDGVR